MTKEFYVECTNTKCEVKGFAAASQLASQLFKMGLEPEIKVKYKQDKLEGK
jgi:Fe2+ transport system protein FeoA